MMVTPGVEVVTVAEIADSLAQPLFLTPRFSRTHSALLITPFPLPVESSIVTPFASSFESPVMVKFCVAVPALVTKTGTEPGVALEQLRSKSAAEAV